MVVQVLAPVHALVLVQEVVQVGALVDVEVTTNFTCGYVTLMAYSLNTK